MTIFYSSYAVIVAGQDVTSRFDPHLLSVKVTRASGEAADTCDLKLSDQDGSIQMPGERAPTQVIIDGMLAFTGFISDVTYAFAKGTGSTLDVSCSSIDQGSKVKEIGRAHV